MCRLFFLALRDLLEDWGLLDAHANEVANDDQDEGEQERYAPTPLHEGVARRNAIHDGQHAGGKQQTCGDADLWAGAVEAALVNWGVLYSHQHGGTPLATSGNTLDDAQEDEQDWGPNTRGVVGGQHADECGGATHCKEGSHEDNAAAEAVSEVSSQECSDRAEQE